MGASSTKYTESFQNQLKVVQKNRKRKDISLSEQEIQQIWKQVSFEYPFMESIADSAIMTDHTVGDEPIIYANDEFTQLTGYPREDILGRNCRFLQGKYTDPKVVQKIRDALREGTKLEVEILNYRRDGTPFLNGFCMLPLHQVGKVDGKVVFFIAIQKNVSVIVNPWRQPMSRWSVPEVCMWLDKPDVQGQAYVRSFLAQDISGAMLEQMTMDGLAALGVVLQSEKERMYRMITQEKAKKIQEKLVTLETSAAAKGSSSSKISVMDDSEADVTTHRSDESEDSAVMTSARSKKKSNNQNSGNNSNNQHDDSGNMRKGLISAEFVDDARPTLPLLASTTADLTELRRVLRKKMGRKFEVEKFESPNGRAQSMRVVLRPTLEGLDSSRFSVLEGIPDPVLVTDNVGLIVFANDRAWEALQLTRDPVETFILHHMTLQVAKLDFVQDLRSNKVSATLPSGATFCANVNAVTVLKSKLHVWTFVPN